MLLVNKAITNQLIQWVYNFYKVFIKYVRIRSEGSYTLSIFLEWSYSFDLTILQISVWLSAIAQIMAITGVCTLSIVTRCSSPMFIFFLTKIHDILAIIAKRTYMIILLIFFADLLYSFVNVTIPSWTLLLVLDITKRMKLWYHACFWKVPDILLSKIFSLSVHGR